MGSPFAVHGSRFAVEMLERASLARPKFEAPEVSLASTVRPVTVQDQGSVHP